MAESIGDGDGRLCKPPTVLRQRRSDYVAAAGRLVFAAGETRKTVEVTVLDDSHFEVAETMTLNLLSASGARIVDRQATGTL